MKKSIYCIYHWLIAMPLMIIITLFISVATVVLTPFSNHAIGYLPARFWGRSACFLFFIKVKINGLDNIQKNQSYIFAANHQSVYDIFILYGWLPVLFKWIMKSTLRRIPFVGAACQAAGHIFIDRTSRTSAKHMLENARKQLTNGMSVIVFPEGTRTQNGTVGKFKRGAFLLATELLLPIIPITIDGAFYCMKRNSAFIRPGTIRITLHPAIESKNYSTEQQKNLVDDCRKAVISSLAAQTNA